MSEISVWVLECGCVVFKLKEYMRTVVVDFETTDLRADIGILIVASYGVLDDDDNIKELHTETIQSISKGSVADREKKLALWAGIQWSKSDIIIGQNHVGFDRHFLDGVLFRNRLPLLPRRILIDTYQTAKGQLGMGASMRNLVDIMGIGEKDAPSKDDWRKANHGDKEALERIKVRCESDVYMTAAMWKRLKPLYMDRKGR